MRDHVRTENGKHPERFDVTQGLGQGRLLPSLLLNVFFDAAIHAVLERFTEDPHILRESVHLEKDHGEDGVQLEPLACLRKV